MNGLHDKNSVDVVSSCMEIVQRKENTNHGEVVIPRTITLIGATSFIVGSIIGSGIFITPKGVVEGSGSVALTLITWTICGLVSMLAALCYAEMGTVIKESGGDYSFFAKAYSPAVAYMFAWSWGLLLKPASMAALAISSAQYLITPLFDDGCGAIPDVIMKLFAISVIMLLAAITVFSSNLASKMQIVFMVAKLAVMGVIIFGGIFKLCQGHTKYLKTGFEGTNTSPGEIMLGFYSGMFAFDGWNAANFLTEEIIKPERNLPLAIIIGVPTVVIVFVLTNVSFFTVLSTQDIIESPVVALTWASKISPKWAWIISIFAAISALDSANGSFFSTSRLIFVAARKGHLPGIFGMINVHRMTPSPACVLIAFCSIMFVVVGDVGSLITFISFIKWIFYGMNMISLIIFRYKAPYKYSKRIFKVPLVIPILVLISSILIVFVPMVTNPKIEFLFALLILLFGYAVYIPFVHFKLRPKCMDDVTTFIQLYLQISTPGKFH